MILTDQEIIEMIPLYDEWRFGIGFDEASDFARTIEAAILARIGDPVAWREFDGEGGYDYRSYQDNETFRDDYRKRNQNPVYRNWVEPLYRIPEVK